MIAGILAIFPDEKLPANMAMADRLISITTCSGVVIHVMRNVTHACGYAVAPACEPPQRARGIEAN